MAATQQELGTTVSTSSANRAPKRSLARHTKNVGDLDRWISSISGGALVAYGAMQRSIPSLALATAGGYLVYRGLSGYCFGYNMLGLSTASQSDAGISVDKSVTINQPAADLYQFWRNFENLPQFMDHLNSVTTLSDKRSHWVAKAPANTSVEWDAEIVEERPNEFISWRSVQGADVDNAGTVSFEQLPYERGTVVRVTLEYTPPAGALGAVVARLFGEEPNKQIADDLRHFKQIMETGEVSTTEGQPHGERSLLGKTLSPNN